MEEHIVDSLRQELLHIVAISYDSGLDLITAGGSLGRITNQKDGEEREPGKKLPQLTSLERQAEHDIEQSED